MYHPRQEHTVCEVWDWNCAQQITVLRKLVDQYRYIVVDCKFPGVVARPVGTFHTTSEYHYQTLRTNVDLACMVQLGLTLTDSLGNVSASGPGTWQFNFRFDKNVHMASSDGLQVLKNSHVDLEAHKNQGIDHFVFAELLISSGLVLNEQVTWVSFHSGYDFGYLVSLMQNKPVPVEKSKYRDLLSIYFPNIWDVKTLVHAFKLSDKSYLSEVARDFGYFGDAGLNTAGFDSRIVAMCFFEMLGSLGEASMRPLKNTLHGLEDDNKLEEEYPRQVLRRHADSPQPAAHPPQFSRSMVYSYSS